MHGNVPLMLRHVSVQPFRLKALPLQNLREFVHLYLRIAENQAKSRLIIFQQTDTCNILILPLHPVIPLCHQRNRQLLRRHPDQPGIVLKPSRNLQDRLRHGGRKKRRLMLSRNLPQNQLHILPEAHIQHFVRLVQHHSIHIIQPDGMPAHMIHHPARRAHDDLYSSETDYLSADLLSPVDGKHLDPMHIFRYLPQLVRRLDSQLSGRAEDNTLQLPQLRINLLQQWNPKCRRFPRPGLCLADYILSVQQTGDRLLLYGRKIFKSHLLNRTKDPFVYQFFPQFLFSLILHFLFPFLTDAAHFPAQSVYTEKLLTCVLLCATIQVSRKFHSFSRQLMSIA